MVDTLPARPRKARGAISNPKSRFDRGERVAIDDGWGHATPDAPDPGAAAHDQAPPDAGDLDDELPPLVTQLERDHSRSIIAHNQSPDVPFAQSINPYRGCEHGCVYCFARPTHAYLGLSPGLDFRSEEHTSELQSLTNLVCRLLLEKKQDNIH